VKKSKNDTAAAEMMPGIRIEQQSASAQPRDTGKRTRLRLFRLEGAVEHAAISELSSGVRNKRNFKRLILAELQFIADAASHAKGSEQFERLPRIGQPSKTLRKLKREAESVRNFAKRLDVRNRIFGLAAPEPPIFELHRYADDLEACAERLRLGSRRRPPRHRTRPETRLILNLAEFIRQNSGSYQERSLAVLLRRPTRVAAYNKASLGALLKYHEAKARKSRIHSLLCFRRVL